MVEHLQSLRSTVQRNCDIADARHARDYTMCVYLLKMREYYRWEQGFAFDAALPSHDLGDWVSRREQLWQELQEAHFEKLAVNGDRFDPFDSTQVNCALLPHGLVYSAGYGNGTRPHFFLAALERNEQRENYTLLVSGREYARDLSAPPAMALQDTIFVRRESLRRMLWEKIEEWRWKRYHNAMGRAIACYDFDGDFQSALDRMTDNETDSAILHEIGELQAGTALGEAWHELLLSLPYSGAELMARAVRDHLADCLVTLPRLLERENLPALHFYFANLRAMREALFPSLMQAYRDWIAGGDLERIGVCAAQGREHWQQVAQCMLDLRRDHGEACAPQIEALIEARHL